MIVVTVHLLSANTGELTQLAMMHVSNVGGDAARGDYDVTTFRGRDRAALARLVPSHRGKVEGYPRQALHIWNLIARALKSAGYA